MKKNREYTADQITVLEGLEPVRVRPGMYIGSTDEKGLHHLVYEVVDNSIDEALAGVCDLIKVTIKKDNSVIVEDDGSGIPVETHPKTGKSTLETVLTVLHAGGKFSNDAYQYSGGLHGVGVSCVNALSTYLIARVKRDGKMYEQRFEKGKTVTELTVIKENVRGTGTTIEFMPDNTIFETLNFDKNVLAKRFREMAFLNKGVKIEFADEREGYKELFHYEGGIKSFVEYINKSKKPLDHEVMYIEGEKETTKVEIAMQYTESYNETIVSFTNNIKTVDGGTHVVGFKSALTRALNDYARNKNILKEKDDNLSGDDVREGITAVVSVKLNNPQFEGQTKGKLGNSEARTVVDSVVYEHLSFYFEENPKIVKTIIQKALASQKARLAARRARDLVRKKSVLDNTTLPGKLADCQSSDIEHNEIFLVEGDSAGGSAKGGRDNKFQAILPLRGKILNVEKAHLERVLNSNEIKAMITAFGTGIGKNFDISKLRYGKIVIMTDADVDGAHIRTLLLTFLYRFMKPLVEKGHVYIAQPPLYGIIKGVKVMEYCYTEKELEEALEKYGERSNIKVQRYKGLGEMNAEQLWDTTMNPEHRILIKVEIDGEDENELDNTFDVLMGDDVEPRREFIEQNAVYAQNIDA
ncbi:DNA topoisomerase (ATP-hydrolyzing) subunit B [Finegoldia sp. BIOML-A2]|uniref:DNA topoisomerase (ATP-hydrolyzing) subunit B n=1 Tax=Finegoldia TaxID=150022 RepID=UPI0012B02C21|nr:MULTISPECIES: DNA topoisomerase (ATP-hydrolyzing) subunit B [Finegoldia]MCC2718001.1 DNA topoisomerase (ATP-hydrolyzing) subunit B [Finegoldia magna]MDU3191983.1 DNA topoisomerase (ATP-hydrolyzing) subunit B [Finegoldia magna]MDU4208535.1 DNA topoisomerase (ATP-hydrolyzing) subunit B [Finegoldia magna]MSA97346.1 DNA topoisomerase (ATP-hydrolyzing) subunit B [Finegoldia sp. BIOML-A5]MSB00672.1 DNA topoisomerase (ATP-hydrolyzing) subunit B [Finegoldia sp. BIOML-A2]